MSKVIYESEKRITQHYGVNGHTGVDLGWRGGSADDVYANCTGEVVYIQTGYKQDISARGMESYGNMGFNWETGTIWLLITGVNFKFRGPSAGCQRQ